MKRWTDEPCISLSFELFMHLVFGILLLHHNVPGHIPNHELLQIWKCFTILLHFRGFHGKMNQSRTRREKQPELDEKAQRIRSPQTVSGSRTCCTWTHLTVGSMWMTNWSTLNSVSSSAEQQGKIGSNLRILTAVTYDLKWTWGDWYLAFSDI